MKPALPARRAAAARHADDWLVTYADMITLLLCFFVLFLSLSLTIAKKEEAARREQLQTAQTEMMVMAQEPAPPVPDPPKEETVATEMMVMAPPVLEQTPAPPEPVFQPEGDRLTTIEMDSAAFFDSGSAVLTLPGREALRGVALKIKDAAYKDYQIAVEGHTDDTPIETSQYPSNWELSTARAVAVVRVFLEEGVSPQRLRAAGYADAFPKLPNRDASGQPIPENRAQNRRVVIRLEKVEKSPAP